MAERHRDRDPNAPQNPPRSVLNRDVRRTALGVYLGPIIAFFVLVGIALLYWATRPPRPGDRPEFAERDVPRAEGTAGHTTPGGHEPQPAPESTREEIEHRGGDVMTELGAALTERGAVGRRIEVADVDVEQVDSPTLFWVRDGNARLPVAIASGRSDIRPGQQVDITGVVERYEGGVRIRASRVQVSP